MIYMGVRPIFCEKWISLNEYLWWDEGQFQCGVRVVCGQATLGKSYCFTICEVVFLSSWGSIANFVSSVEMDGQSSFAWEAKVGDVRAWRWRR